MEDATETTQQQGEAPLRKPEKFLGHRHFQIFLLFLAVTIGYSLRVNMSIAIVVMTNSSDSNSDFKTYNWNNTERSTVLSSFFWGYLVTQIPAGQLGERFGARFFLSGAMALAGVFTILTPLAADLGGWGLVCASRIIQGMCQGFLYPSVHTLLARWAPPDEKGRANTIVYAGGQLGTVIAMPLCGLLATSGGGWPSIFYVFGSLTLAWSALFLVFGANMPSQSRFISQEERIYIEQSQGRVQGQEKPPTPWRAICTSVPMWSLLIVHCAQNWGFWTLLTEMPTYMASILHFKIGDNGLLSALPYLTMWLLSFVFSWLSHFLDQRKLLNLTVSRKLFNTIAHWGPALALLGLSFSGVEDPTPAVVLLTVSVGLNAGTYVGYLVNHLDLSPNFAGTLMGITNGLSNITSILGPLTVGFLVKEDTQEEWKVVFWLAAGIYFVGDLVFVLFGSAQVQPWNDPDYNSKDKSQSLDAKM